MSNRIGELTEDAAWELYQAHQVNPEKRNRTRNMRTTYKEMVGQYLVIFHDGNQPFYMDEFGHVTEEWRESRTFETSDDARDLVRDLLRAKPLNTYDYKEMGKPRKNDPWDRNFIAHIDSALIYLIERTTPERWAVNENLAKG